MSSILEILKKYHKKIDALDLELIISEVIKKPREFVIAHPEYKIIKNYELKITNYLKRRINGEPLAYIFSDKEFYGLKFKVNKNVLVPRPETEMMVDWSKQKTENRKQNFIFIDAGTGSGCIIVTLAKLLNNPPHPLYQEGIYKFLATDISKSALKIARQNAKFHKVDKQIKFIHGNLLEPILKNCKLLPARFAKASARRASYKLIILANLPYLTPKQIKNSPTIKYEPKLALDAGGDGLKYYRELFRQIKQLKMLCVMCYVLCEIDPSQTSKIKKLIKNNFPSAKIVIKKDLRGLNRFVVMEI